VKPPERPISPTFAFGANTATEAIALSLLRWFAATNRTSKNNPFENPMLEAHKVFGQGFEGHPMCPVGRVEIIDGLNGILIEYYVEGIKIDPSI
jgi:hypothetical protein